MRAASRWQAKALAERHKLPPRHLEPVLQALVHAGVLKGVRGPRGGYRAGARAAPHFRGRDRARRRSDRRRRERGPAPALVSRVVGPAIDRTRRKRSRTRLPASASKSLCQEAEKLGLADAEASADFNI